MPLVMEISRHGCVNVAVELLIYATRARVEITNAIVSIAVDTGTVTQYFCFLFASNPNNFYRFNASSPSTYL